MFENKITIEKRDELEKYLGAFEYKTSGLSFSSLYMWREINDFSYQKFGDYICVNGVNNLEDRDGENFIFPPLTSDHEYDAGKMREAINLAREFYAARSLPFVIELCPIHILDVIKEAFPTGLEIDADRANFDYLYRTEDLQNLSGKSYHSKKNHLNYFRSHYDFDYVPLTYEMKDEVMAFTRAFNERKTGLSPHEMKLLKMEEDAVRDVLDNLDSIGYLTGAIMIDKKIEALCIAGRLGKKTVTVHFEKANINFRGAYQAINNEFAKALPPEIKFINREEDMGIFGLRKAKLSYNPCRLIEKYTVKFK
jgi:hypothetical protein